MSNSETCVPSFFCLSSVSVAVAAPVEEDATEPLTDATTAAEEPVSEDVPVPEYDDAPAEPVVGDKASVPVGERCIVGHVAPGP